jgi:hypothetical protein
MWLHSQLVGCCNPHSPYCGLRFLCAGPILLRNTLAITDSNRRRLFSIYLPFPHRIQTLITIEIKPLKRKIMSRQLEDYTVGWISALPIELDLVRRHSSKHTTTKKRFKLVCTWSHWTPQMTSVRDAIYSIEYQLKIQIAGPTVMSRASSSIHWHAPLRALMGIRRLIKQKLDYYFSKHTVNI